MLTTDACGGFRQFTYDESVPYAVSLSTVCYKSRRYDCPVCYHWASTDEEKRIFHDDTSKLGARVYAGQCNWTGAEWVGKLRYFSDFVILR